MRRGLPERFSFAAEAVAIGASAGGIDALFTLLEPLHGPVRPAIIVVLHLPEQHESRLVQVPGMPTLNIADFPEAYGPIKPTAPAHEYERRHQHQTQLCWEGSS